MNDRNCPESCELCNLMTFIRNERLTTNDECTDCPNKYYADEIIDEIKKETCIACSKCYEKQSISCIRNE